jgi:hypothetical protein
MDWPIFSSLTPVGVRIIEPGGWKHKWLSPVLRKLQPELQVLEFPANMAAFVTNHGAVALFDFRGFKNLKYLSVSSSAWCSFPRRPPPNPVQLLPKGLEMLRMSECTSPTINLINEICLAKKQGNFPSLVRIELYFSRSVRFICDAAQRRRNPHPVNDTPRICADAGIELYMYFPICCLSTRGVGRTPWSLREEGIWKLKEAEHLAMHPEQGPGWLELEPFELGSDLDGDILMMG